jgi:hypothetical protein
VRPGGTRVYARHETTLASWERPKLPLARRAGRTPGPPQVAGEQAWTARLAALALTDERPVGIATAGALVGGWLARGVSPAGVVRRDGAPPFVVLVHAAGWVHAERPLAKRVPPNEEHRAARDPVRGPSWAWYQDWTAYREPPPPGQGAVLARRFEALVEQRTA